MLWTSALSCHFRPQNSFPKEVALLIGANDLNAARFLPLPFPQKHGVFWTYFSPPASALVMSPLINVGYVHGPNSPQVLSPEQLCWS